MVRNVTSHQRQLSSVFASIGEGTRGLQVVDRIIEGIGTGVLTDGDRLPSEAEMSASMGVAVMTAREALAILRARNLAQTRRGRDGGTFIMLSEGGRHDILQNRLQEMNRVQLRDLAIHYSVILAGAAELAVTSADEAEVQGLPDMLNGEKAADCAPADRIADLMLEITALSRSARLTQEYMKLHSAFGAFLYLAHTDESFNDTALKCFGDILDAFAAGDGLKVRQGLQQYIRLGATWLIDALPDNAAEHKENSETSLGDRSIR